MCVCTCIYLCMYVCCDGTHVCMNTCMWVMEYCMCAHMCVCMCAKFVYIHMCAYTACIHQHSKSTSHLQCHQSHDRIEIPLGTGWSQIPGHSQTSCTTRPTNLQLAPATHEKTRTYQHCIQSKSKREGTLRESAHLLNDFKSCSSLGIQEVLLLCLLVGSQELVDLLCTPAATWRSVTSLPRMRIELGRGPPCTHKHTVTEQYNYGCKMFHATTQKRATRKATTMLRTKEAKTTNRHMTPCYIDGSTTKTKYPHIKETKTGKGTKPNTTKSTLTNTNVQFFFLIEHKVHI